MGSATSRSAISSAAAIQEKTADLGEFLSKYTTNLKMFAISFSPYHSCWSLGLDGENKTNCSASKYRDSHIIEVVSGAPLTITFMMMSNNNNNVTA